MPEENEFLTEFVGAGESDLPTDEEGVANELGVSSRGVEKRGVSTLKFPIEGSDEAPPLPKPSLFIDGVEGTE